MNIYENNNSTPYFNVVINLFRGNKFHKCDSELDFVKNRDDYLTVLEQVLK